MHLFSSISDFTSFQYQTGYVCVNTVYLIISPRSCSCSLLMHLLMPSHKAEFHCICESCIATSSTDAARNPVRRIFPASQKHAHLACIKAERDAIKIHATHAQDPGIPDQVFALTLMDKGPNMETQPSKLWTSHVEHQDDSTAQPIFPEATLIIDSIMESMVRLPVRISQPQHPSLEPNNLFPALDL